MKCKAHGILAHYQWLVLGPGYNNPGSFGADFDGTVLAGANLRHFGALKPDIYVRCEIGIKKAISHRPEGRLFLSRENYVITGQVDQVI